MFNSKMETIIDQYKENTELLDELRLSINSSFVMAQNKIAQNIEKYVKEIELANKELSEIETSLSYLIEKMKGVSEIKVLKDRIAEQVSYLNELERKEKVMTELTRKNSKIKDDIIDRYQKIFDIKQEIKHYFNSKDYFSNLKLQAYICFKNIDFNQLFMGAFNKRGKLFNIFPNCYAKGVFDEESDGFIFSEEKFTESIKYLLETVLFMEDNKLKKSYTKKKAIEELLNPDFVDVIFDIEKDGDRLSQMSPGKRGLILLELFLDMSNDKHPILIDQPEDNLDNRTISTELVRIIREKSQERQIIIVTHNANLVVLADAENVIVANQDKTLNENDSHRFEYVNGALECDFDDGTNKISGKGIKTHVCEILEGGKMAFEKRERKYRF
ncbi:hypothetical protein JS80_12105 [Anoxybacillus sp. KU2-6(11)]|nr:hypothetical protein JS80_12105 [Anoxybacillus sp. KU2-6(11)]